MGRRDRVGVVGMGGRGRTGKVKVVGGTMEEFDGMNVTIECMGLDWHDGPPLSCRFMAGIY